MSRWWDLFKKLPYLDEVASVSKVAISLQDDTKNLEIRRTIVRYCILLFVLCLRKSSSQLRRQFPTVVYLVHNNLATEEEVELMGEENPQDILRLGGSNWWLPIDWVFDIIRKAQLEGRMFTPPLNTMLVDRVCDYRRSLAEVAAYGHVTIPLVYTQVVHLAVYANFAAFLIGKQWIQRKDDAGEEQDFFCLPLFLVFKFLFFFGWLNVAVSMYNPLGNDDADFELLDILDRNIKVAHKLVEVNSVPAFKNVEFWKSSPRSLEDENKADRKGSLVSLVERSKSNFVL